ncbi:MAG: ribose 5-phosphate isomerase B [Thermoguttaceae bacterium]|nr:ribose 5-phosphate isomerase B [Thermoguttaceae bacterium]MBR0192147.1 ribose 5-phosphate isomerase B [Thermoguttaceae bacterium]
MRIAIGSDHRGVTMKAKVIEILRQNGHEIIECIGEVRDNAIDYPDVARQVAAAVSKNEVDRGILICGTGIGMSIVANKFPNVRAAVCGDELTAEISRRHNNLNVLCLSGDMLGANALEGILNKWLKTEFEGGRHERRIQKIAQIEADIAAGNVF